MHEVALCESLIDIICEQQQENGFSRVFKVIVEVGALGHVEPEALRFAFDVQAQGSPAAGATLEILEVGGRARCVECDDVVAIARRGDPCPGCGGFNMIVEQGDELRLKQLEVG